MPNLVYDPDGPFVKPGLQVHESSHIGILFIVVRGDLNSDWVEFLDPFPKDQFIVCDAHNIDTSSILDHTFLWCQVGDFLEEYSNINPDELSEDSEPYYIDSTTRLTGNIENMNTLDELLYYFSDLMSPDDYVLVTDTNVFSAEEVLNFPILLMRSYASYETTPVICFIINGKPCYAIRPNKIKTMSATTPILEVKGEALVRIIDVNSIEDTLASLKLTGNSGSEAELPDHI